MRQCVAALRDCKLLSLSERDLEELVLSWRRRGLSEWTRRRRLVVVKQWLPYCERSGHRLHLRLLNMQVGSQLPRRAYFVEKRESLPRSLRAALEGGHPVVVSY